MQRRKFLQYAATSGLGILSGGYVTKNGLNSIQNNFGGATQRAIATRHKPLLIPGDKGALGVLDMTNAPIILTAKNATFPLIRASRRRF